LSRHRLAKSVTKFLDLHRAHAYLQLVDHTASKLSSGIQSLSLASRIAIATELRPDPLALRPLVAFLPAPFAYSVACLLGDWRYWWDTYVREGIMGALSDVLGDQLSPAERGRVTRDYFRLRSCEGVDKLRLAGRGRALARLVEIRGLKHIEAALAAGKGAILCSAHFGSYASGFSLIGAHGFPITVISRRPSNFCRPIERFLFQLVEQMPVEHHRHRPNIQPWGQFDTAVQAATILRQNELIGICLDPPVLAADRRRAVPVDFLNGQALLLPGAITIAQLTGAPVLMTFMRRMADWRHQVLEISPPMPLDGDTMKAFRRCLAVVEAAIRQDPAHWFYWEPPALVEMGLLPEKTLKAHCAKPIAHP
jgi:lauroyl/myristoyl acyltransferase